MRKGPDLYDTPMCDCHQGKPLVAAKIGWPFYWLWLAFPLKHMRHLDTGQPRSTTVFPRIHTAPFVSIKDARVELNNEHRNTMVLLKI